MAEEYHSALIVIFIFGNNLQLFLRADNYKIPAYRQTLTLCISLSNSLQ